LNLGYLAEITFLGTGATLPTTERFLPSILVRDRMGDVILLDVGEGAQFRLAQLNVSPSSIDVIAITHEHGDHVNGLPGLLQSMYVSGRSRKLTIVAPASVAQFISEVLAGEDRLGFKVDVVIARGRGSLEVGRSSGDTLTLAWFPVCHTVEAYGYTLEWRLRPRVSLERVEALGLKPGPWIRDLIERGEVRVGDVRVKLEDVVEARGVTVKLSYTGDTAPCEVYVESIRGSRILIHDSTFHSELESEAASRGHSTSRDAALKAREAGVELLALTHISSRYRGFEARRLLEEARGVFPNTILARDLLRVTLGAHSVR
jgi:ribonuclease Z